MTDTLWWHLLFGELSYQSLPFYSAIATFAAGLTVIGALATAGLITWYRKWAYLWTEWLTSVDHKKIGIMYVVVALVMLSRAVIEACLMRTQQALAYRSGGILPAEHFAQLFTTHGTIMIFFMGMPFLIGMINYAMPMQIGARDVSFPVLNSISLWLTAAGAGLMMVSLDLGRFSTGGWSGYPPYTEQTFSPGVGVDYWIFAVTLSGIGSTMTGLNFAVTIYKKRCPGMHMFRMTLFTWTALCMSILMIFAMPPLTVATALLALDRYADMHFFTNAAGGNMMNYINLFWLFGHPEVYILILPAFGVYSELVSNFSGKTLYGYNSLVYATMSIAVLSFTVWLHHFFTMGQSANVNAAFGVATMLIGIPTGVKIYDWIFTMYRGRVRFTVPMLYSMGFICLFAVGGTTGIVLASPGVDYQVHNTVFLVAHFHNVLIPGLLFGMLGATHYWFPKAFGFRLDERWGRISFFFWLFGFLGAFMPLYALGLLGLPRRTQEYFDPAYRPWTMIALGGAALIACALASWLYMLAISIRRRDSYGVTVGDPWDGRTLEWSMSAPPPEWNFPTVPTVHGVDPFWDMKRERTAYRMQAEYEDIELPANSMLGPVVGISLGLAAFGLVWHIWWLLIAGFVANWVGVIARCFVTKTTRTVSASEVRAHDERWLADKGRVTPTARLVETTSMNAGLATASVR